MRPVTANIDVINDRLRNAEHGGKLSLRYFLLEKGFDVPGFLVGEFSAAVLLPDRRSAMDNSIRTIAFRGLPTHVVGIDASKMALAARVRHQMNVGGRRPIL